MFIVSWAALVGGVVAFFAWGSDRGSASAVASDSRVTVSRAASSTAAATATPLATPAPPSTPTPFPLDAWVDPANFGRPYPGERDGLLTFRGNPSRSYYGQGPVPSNPVVQWRFGAPDELCSFSTVGAETTKWCGTGWTGQPAVFDYEDRRWVVVGSFAPAVHFLDAATGDRLRPDFEVDDLIKGSVTIDPDGFPLVYVGSRDNFFRVVAFDRDTPAELWSLSADAVEPTMWNDDWDGTALVLDDHLFVGGENGQWHVVKLNRAYDLDGHAIVNPQLIFNAPGWDDELLEVLSDGNVSIETSITISGDLLWFANSGGLVQAWDIGPLRRGTGDPTRVLRFWTGDDTDASIVVDEAGFAYVGVELERANSRAVELGQIMKLDPRRPDDPLVWSRDIHIRVPDGVWATPAIHRDVLYVPTNEGKVFALDRATGEIRWEMKLQGPVWSSPVVVDDVLIQADCAGLIHAYDVSDTSIRPPELWAIGLPWCIESTPAVWDGGIYVGHRRGEIWGIADN